MNTKDYELMIHICQHLLRKGYDLNFKQVADIDNMIKKLYDEKQKRTKRNAVVRSKKMGKRQGI
jgi:hypothetical protein